VVVQNSGDFGLGNYALDEGTAISSHLPAKFDEDVFVVGLDFGQRLGQSRVPFYRAIVVEVWMRFVRHFYAPILGYRVEVGFYVALEAESKKYPGDC